MPVGGKQMSYVWGIPVKSAEFHCDWCGCGIWEDDSSFYTENDDLLCYDCWQKKQEEEQEEDDDNCED